MHFAIFNFHCHSRSAPSPLRFNDSTLSILLCLNLDSTLGPMLFGAFFPEAEKNLHEIAKKWSTEETFLVALVMAIFLVWFLKRRRK